MEDLPTSLLTQQAQAKPRTGEELETFGKHAANLFLSGRCKTLTSSVVESVKTAGLAPEQVRRVVEFANTNAFLEKFAAEGPEHKVVTFDGGPASFPDVIRDLNDGGEPQVFSKSASLLDYSLPPPNLSQLASNNFTRLTGDLDTKLAEAFHVEEEIQIPYSDPLRQAYDMKDKLAGLYDEAQHEINQLETQYMELCDLLYGQVKQASLEGVPLGHVVQVFESVTQDADFFKAAFEMLTPRLLQGGIFPGGAELADSLTKTASSGLVDPAHPMVDLFKDYCGTLLKLAATRGVQEDVVDQLDVIGTFLHKAANAEAAGKVVGKVLGQVPKAWRAVTGATARASKPVGEFVSEAVGPNAGTVAGGAVKYAPHLAAALAGEEVYQHLKNDPAAQAAENFVLARIPYTRQNMIRQYNLQMGQ